MKHEISKSFANILLFSIRHHQIAIKSSQIILKSRNLTVYQLASTAFSV